MLAQGTEGRRDGNSIDADQVRRVVSADVGNACGVQGRGVGRRDVDVAAIDDGPGVVQEQGRSRGSRTGDADDVDALASLDHAAAPPDATRAASSRQASAEARLLPSRSCGQMCRSTTAWPSRSAAAT